MVQCWDDGVTTDIRLVDLLRRHGAKASFNLNAGLHGASRGHGWTFMGTSVERLARAELRAVYDGFTIANHSLTHPHLDRIPIDEARREIAEGRDRLQQWFGQPVVGFAYPFGTFNAAVQDAVREAGHRYARYTVPAERPYPPADPMAFHTSCHFLAPDFWSRYERARDGGVFYFWGHSYEMVNEALWSDFEARIERISRDPAARWGDLAALF